MLELKLFFENLFLSILSQEYISLMCNIFAFMTSLLHLLVCTVYVFSKKKKDLALGPSPTFRKNPRLLNHQIGHHIAPISFIVSLRANLERGGGIHLCRGIETEWDVGELGGGGGDGGLGPTWEGLGSSGET